MLVLILARANVTINNGYKNAIYGGIADWLIMDSLPTEAALTHASNLAKAHNNEPLLHFLDEKLTRVQKDKPNTAFLHALDTQDSGQIITPFNKALSPDSHVLEKILQLAIHQNNPSIAKYCLSSRKFNSITKSSQPELESTLDAALTYALDNKDLSKALLWLSLITLPSEKNLEAGLVLTLEFQDSGSTAIWLDAQLSVQKRRLS